MVRELDYTAPASVRAALASIGRTEDVRFSPSGRRLAVAGFERNRILVLDIDITLSASGPHLALIRSVQLASPALRLPHGLSFVDEDTLVVTSREGDVDLFEVPVGGTGGESREVRPTLTWPARESGLLQAPSAVCVTSRGRDEYEILICNNDAHTVTRHRLDWGGNRRISGGEVLLEKSLAVPDGASVSANRRWIAVSNNGTCDVLLFETSPSLNRAATPDGILRGAREPHGLRFVEDDHYLFVADGAAPFVHIYAEGTEGWRGVRYPLASVRIMDDATFERGHFDRGNGGPKGLDIEPNSRVLVTTAKCQPLAFFDLPAMLRSIPSGRSAAERMALDLNYELESMDERRLALLQNRQSRRLIQYMRGSKSWRLTEPLRRIHSVLSRVVSRH